MLVTIGRTQKKEDLVDDLLECHERIRRFSQLARSLGERANAAPGEVIEACDRCVHYFAHALPLHVADEEESLVPRLEGLSPAVDEALATMAAQHHAHESLLARALDALRKLHADPASLVHRAELALVAEPLAAELEQHLKVEETVLFPAVRARLPAAVQAQIKVEMRARRG